MLTLTRTRDAATRLLTLRSEIAERKAEADALTATLRDALPHWGPVNTGTRSVFLAAGSTRKGWSTDALLTLARSLGATDAQIEACATLTPVSPSVRDRAPQATDR